MGTHRPVAFEAGEDFVQNGGDHEEEPADKERVASCQIREGVGKRHRECHGKRRVGERDKKVSENVHPQKGANSLQFSSPSFLRKVFK